MGTLFNVDAVTGDIVTAGAITSTSTTSGFLLPKMTTLQRDAIPTPATGLQIFNTSTNRIEIYDGISWVPASTSTPAGANTQIQYNNSGAFGADSDLTFNSATNVLSVPAISAPISNGSVIINNGQDVPRVDLASTSTANAILQLRNATTPFNWQFLASGTTGVLQIANVAGTSIGMRLSDVSGAAQLSLGSSNADASAVLDLQSTIRGFLPPRMTTTQRNAISSPATGLEIYNTTTVQPEVYNGTSWVGMGGSGSGTVNTGTANNLALYPSTGTTVDDNVTISGQAVTIGLNASMNGPRTFLIADPSTSGGSTIATFAFTSYTLAQNYFIPGITYIDPASGQASIAVSANGNINSKIGKIVASTSIPNSTTRTFTLPEPGADANFVVSEGAATINGIKTFGNAPVLPSTSFSATSITPDATLSSTVFVSGLSGATTINGPTGGFNGQRINFRIIQGGTPQTVAFSTGAGNFRFSLDVPSYSASGANLTDYVAAIYNSTANRWDIVSVIQGF